MQEQSVNSFSFLNVCVFKKMFLQKSVFFSVPAELFLCLLLIYVVENLHDLFHK